MELALWFAKSTCASKSAPPPLSDPDGPQSGLTFDVSWPPVLFATVTLSHIYARAVLWEVGWQLHSMVWAQGAESFEEKEGLEPQHRGMVG